MTTCWTAVDGEGAAAGTAVAFAPFVLRKEDDIVAPLVVAEDSVFVLLETIAVALFFPAVVAAFGFHLVEVFAVMTTPATGTVCAKTANGLVCKEREGGKKNFRLRVGEWQHVKRHVREVNRHQGRQTDTKGHQPHHRKIYIYRTQTQRRAQTTVTRR